MVFYLPCFSLFFFFDFFFGFFFFMTSGTSVQPSSEGGSCKTLFTFCFWETLGEAGINGVFLVEVCSFYIACVRSQITHYCKKLQICLT
jgi:hypothetical protein